MMGLPWVVAYQAVECSMIADMTFPVWDVPTPQLHSPRPTAFQRTLPATNAELIPKRVLTMQSGLQGPQHH